LALLADDNDGADFEECIEDELTARVAPAAAGAEMEVEPMFALCYRPLARTLVCAAALIIAVSTGCQVDVGGQTLPSPYYLQDDIQYFPAGPRMKLSREAAAMKAYQEEEALRATREAQP